MGDGDRARISGSIVWNHMVELRERYPGAVDAALDRIDPTARAEVADALAIGWVDLDAYEAFYQAVAREAGRALAELHTEVSRVSVERTLTTVHRLLMRFTTDNALMSRTPIIYAKTFDRGSLEPAIPEPGRGEIDVVGWPGMPEMALRGLRIGVETVLRVAGRKGVQVAGASARDGAHLTATWTVK